MEIIPKTEKNIKKNQIHLFRGSRMFYIHETRYLK